ncbi:unnamed protein product [Linum tenue]|uniref:Uncharacterized protein n=1 Tax=Linum tenue TaxID=586396 RepID=A0AAV0LPQ3_9ROSI|nr:unnamed protein product [Linum tenue]
MRSRESLAKGIHESIGLRGTDESTKPQQPGIATTPQHFSTLSPTAARPKVAAAPALRRPSSFPREPPEFQPPSAWPY